MEQLTPDLDVHVDQLFSGPFDLLLHLVRKHELNLLDIPLAFLAERYLAAVRQLQELNIDLASDFLVIAATLVEWKSRVMLPRPEEEPFEDEDDPAQELARRLLLYQKFRRAAAFLRGALQADRRVWVRGRSVAQDLPANEELEPITTDQLHTTFLALLPRLQALHFRANADHERLTLSERFNELIDVLELHERLSFWDLFEQTRPRDVGEVVITFLSLLEIARLGLASIHQTASGKLYIVRTEKVLQRLHDSH